MEDQESDVSSRSSTSVSDSNDVEADLDQFMNGLSSKVPFPTCSIDSTQCGTPVS